MESLKNIVWPPPGKYLVAVSGGVDSSALLHALVNSAPQQIDIEAAHFNHQWSAESDRFEQAAKALAEELSVKVHCGSEPVARSEAKAREARYKYLRAKKIEIGADAIITAHHQDDLVETMTLSVIRGTGRRGLVPFTASDLLRPLLGVRKAELVRYAQEQQLRWVYDPTNADVDIARNRLRQALKRLSAAEQESWHQSMVDRYVEAKQLNQLADKRINNFVQSSAVDASVLRQQPFNVASELIVQMAQLAKPGVELDRRAVEALVVDIKTGRFKAARNLTNALSVANSHGTVTIVFSP